MKLLPLLPLAGTLVAFFSPLTAATVPADAHITAATVYLDRAVVTRTASVELPATGPVELTFEKLPPTLLDQSLQVSGQGSATATLLDVTARPTFVDFTPNERVKALEDQLLALNRDDRTLADRIVVLGQQRDYVFKIQNATTTPPKEPTASAPDTNAWLTLLKFSEDQLAKIAADIQATERQREELQTKRTALEQQLNELRGDGGRSYKTVTVRLAVAAAGRLDLTLRYTVPGANWTPRYDARAATSESTVQLGYFGLVRQNTGEDWTAIDLTLSTARPSLGGAAPELQPWVVQQREIRPLPAATSLPAFDKNDEGAQKSKTWGGVMLRKQAAAGESFSASYYEAPPIREMATADTAIETQATSATFRIAGKTDLPSDNAPHKVAVATVTFKADFHDEATPKLVPTAFLTAKVTNTSDYPLLAGTMNVFLNETFVATSALRAVMPGEKLDLALGADEALSVKRKLNNRFTEDTGLVNKGRRITYDYTLSVQNNKKVPAKLTLVDQLPVSRHEKIVVKLLAPDEKDPRPDADGALKWNLSLAPGEKRDLPLKFSVEYPSDLPVTGLE